MSIITRLGLNQKHILLLGNPRRRTRQTYATPPSRRSSCFTTPDPTPRTNRRRRRSPDPISTPFPPTPSSPEAPPSSEAGEFGNPDEAPPMFVCGTNISVQDVTTAIPGKDDGSLEGKYMMVINHVIEIQGESLEVDAHHVFDYDNDLYNKMVRYPLEVLAIFDIVLMDMVSRINPLFEKHIQARIFNLKTYTTMRNLNPSGRISEPTSCGKQECLAKNSMTLVHNRCRFADKQVVRLQETPDEIPDGGMPHTVSLFMYDKLVDAGVVSQQYNLRL